MPKAASHPNATVAKRNAQHHLLFRARTLERTTTKTEKDIIVLRAMGMEPVPSWRLPSNVVAAVGVADNGDVDLQNLSWKVRY